MRIPFLNDGNNSSRGYNSNRGFASHDNPFGGKNITQLTERVLSDDSDIGFVTSEGFVMPRNDAYKNGFKIGIQPVKIRIWGFDDEADESGDSETEQPDVEVIFSPEAVNLIALESQKSRDLETGGALIGTWERDTDGRLSVHVERATGPGQNATHQHGLFKPNMDYYRYRIGYYRQFGKWDYLGEWHKHPGSFDSLSSTDIATARSLMREEGWPLLLLPIINVVNGEMTLENNVFLSQQLGGEFLQHVSSMTIEPGVKPKPMSVYIDSRYIEDFRAGSEKVRTIEGLCNPGESFVFIPLPELSNAVLKLVKSDSGASVSGVENAVTAIVSSSGLKCYCAHEGEIEQLEHIIIDPANSIYERNAGLTETSVLKDKAVTLVGCGSLGSTLAMSLARAGVGTFYLFDCDSLSPVNIARHQAGLRDLGRGKAAVLRDLIHGTNPVIDVDVCELDIVKSEDGFEAFQEAASRSDLLICTTDTDDSRLIVNEEAVSLGIKSIQAGLGERAAVGIVHLYDPASGEACWQCHRDRVLVESDKRSEGVAYSEAKDIRDLTVQPGLAAQINTVAEIAALRCIEALMGSSLLPSLTVAYIDTPDDPDAPDDAKGKDQRQLCLRLRHLGLERVPSCPVCGEARFEQPDFNSEYDDEDEDGFGDTELADGSMFAAEAGGV